MLNLRGARWTVGQKPYWSIPNIQASHPGWWNSQTQATDMSICHQDVSTDRSECCRFWVCVCCMLIVSNFSAWTSPVTVTLTFNHPRDEDKPTNRPHNWTPASSIQTRLSVIVATSHACLQAHSACTDINSLYALVRGCTWLVGQTTKLAVLIFRLWKAICQACFGCLIQWWIASLHQSTLGNNQTLCIQ